jgi:peptidoglycan DL-endopeptidase CwlO
MGFDEVNMHDVTFSGRQLKEPKGARHRKGFSSVRLWWLSGGAFVAVIALTIVLTTYLGGGFSGNLSGQKEKDMRAFQLPAPANDELTPAVEPVSEAEQAWIDNIRNLSAHQQAQAAEKKRQEDEALRQQQLAAAAQAKLTAVSASSTAPIEGTAWLVGDQSQARAIDIYLTEVESPLVGFGRAFVSAGRTYGVDPFLVVSIAGKESSWGKHCFLPYNAWGWGDLSFKNWEDAIFNYTRGLSEEYIKRGRTTPEVIAPIYCPPNHAAWARDVNSFYAELTGVYAAVQR